jgi:hypothetical protein
MRPVGSAGGGHEPANGQRAILGAKVKDFGIFGSADNHPAVHLRGSIDEEGTVCELASVSGSVLSLILSRIWLSIFS